ncbi:hypothetical protein [Pseudonocardia sp. ICBG162]|uniref:hypothetical protein n=2 Tax=Pseudonocardia sp. ICBG162 TaxID=2846761 RepID=UPI001CF70F6C|nr:hypothetical protein [Pseudonocardia sp. ICBG162]
MTAVEREPSSVAPSGPLHMCEAEIPVVDRRALGDVMRRQDEISFHAEHLLSFADSGPRGGRRRSGLPPHSDRPSNVGTPGTVKGQVSHPSAADRREQRKLTMDLLLVREQARHHGEWQDTRSELEFLVEASPAALTARLERDLSALSAAAISALAAIRAATGSGSDAAPGAADGTGHWLPSAAAALRSALSIDLALEAQQQFNAVQGD